MSQIFFCLQPRVNGHGSVCHEPCSKTNFLTIYFCWRGGAPLPFWGPSQSFGFSLPPLLVSGDLRLLSTNTCWYPLCDPHSLLTVTFLTGFHCSFQREDSINLTSIISVGYHMTISTQFKMSKTVLFLTIQFNTRTYFSSIWPIDRTLFTQSLVQIQFFVYTQLNNQTVLFQTIQFTLSTVFVYT